MTQNHNGGKGRQYHIQLDGIVRIILDEHAKIVENRFLVNYIHLDMKITGEEARNAVYGESETFELIQETLVDSSRWSLSYEAIIKQNETGKHYSTNYEIGATESQDEQPYEYQDEVILKEVEEREVKVKQWVAVEGSKPE